MHQFTDCIAPARGQPDSRVRDAIELLKANGQDHRCADARVGQSKQVQRRDGCQQKRLEITAGYRAVSNGRVVAERALRTQRAAAVSMGQLPGKIDLSLELVAGNNLVGFNERDHVLIAQLDDVQKR
jgi:hypothetical protein